jgi:hypothetical protein
MTTDDVLRERVKEFLKDGLTIEIEKDHAEWGNRPMLKVTIKFDDTVVTRDYVSL